MSEAFTPTWQMDNRILLLTMLTLQTAFARSAASMLDGTNYSVENAFLLPEKLRPGSYDLRLALVDDTGQPRVRLGIEGADGQLRYRLGILKWR
jgi:hypothetical protein